MTLLRLARQALRDPLAVVSAVLVAGAGGYLAWQWSGVAILSGFALAALVARVLVLSEKRPLSARRLIQRGRPKHL